MAKTANYVLIKTLCKIFATPLVIPKKPKWSLIPSIGWEPVNNSHLRTWDAFGTCWSTWFELVSWNPPPATFSPQSVEFCSSSSSQLLPFLLVLLFLLLFLLHAPTFSAAAPALCQVLNPLQVRYLCSVASSGRLKRTSHSRGLGLAPGGPLHK